MNQEQITPDHEEPGWISLQEASERLGVATATIRRWGDAGRVPMKRTLGGHRRFLAAAIEQLVSQMQPVVTAVTDVVPIQSHSSQANHSSQVWGINSHEMNRQQWHARLAAHSHPDRMRSLGQQLLGLLIQFINRQPADQRFLDEAHTVGANYGHEARVAGISMHDTIEAFLFFRRSFSQLAMPLPGIAQPTDLAEAAHLQARIQHFMDATLLGTIKGYESGPNTAAIADNT